jgi:argonaute family protein
MAFLPKFERTPVVLNRFFVKQLIESDCVVQEYSCSFQQNPEQGDEQKAIASICYKVGVTAIRLGSKIITKEPIQLNKRRSSDWELKEIGTKVLNCENPLETKALESFERKLLKQRLKNWSSTDVEQTNESGLIWWITGEDGKEKCGKGWEVHRGRRIDVVIDSEGRLYLEIDLHHRFYTPWTLHQWLEQYPDIPINYVRNTYKDKNNKYITWKYESLSEQTPTEVMLDGLGITLADYHRQNGATEGEVQSSRVVYVKRPNQPNSRSVAHLSERLSPSLTMEMLASIAEQSGKPEIDSRVFQVKNDPKIK